MTAFLLVWGLLQSLDFALSRSCLPRLDYVCKEIPTSYPADISSLVLWVTNLGEINSTVFNNTHLSSVTSLTLRDTGITAIAPGSFDKFQSLKLLDLSKNNLSLVTSAWFTQQTTLEELRLPDNSITALNDDAFHGLSGLLRLNLSHNQIQTVSSKTFHSLRKLSHLDLSNNKLNHLNVETLHPLNNTKIRLNGNPWNCSYAQFAVFLKELQKASLLENEMEVLCDSPACLRGVPVWNVSECVEPNTTVKPTTGDSPSPPSEIKHINWSVLISLIVVLCALVLVICVLSVLYHRKVERKHLQAIQPSAEEPESGKHPPSDCSQVLQHSNMFKPHSKKKPNYKTEVLLSKDQAVLESEKVSQIYQIYGPGINQSREISNRAKSAGPVLSRAEIFAKQPGVVVEVQKPPEVNLQMEKELYARWEKTEMEKEEENDVEILGWMTESKKEQQECRSGEEEELQKMTKKEQKPPQSGNVNVNHEFNSTSETQEMYKDDLLMEGAKKKNSKKQDFLLSDNDDDLDDTVSNVDTIQDNLTSSLARHDPSQPGSDDTVQPSEDSETIPYLTIGTDPENQNSQPEQTHTEASTKQVPSRPLRRVLTWPPTAVQWKNQQLQNQQDLNVFPKLGLVTERQHQNSPFPFSSSSVSSESIPSSCGSESVHKLSREEVTHIKSVETLKEICKSTIQSYIPNMLNLTEDYAEGKKAHTSIIYSNPLLNSKEQRDLSHRNPLSEELHSKANKQESKIPNKSSKSLKASSKKRKTDQTSTSKQMSFKSERQSRRREKEGKKECRGQRHQSSSGSRAPPSGGSPNDDTLLVDNEYAFIDLLHEVVENHGRWTRDKWRQSHINRHKKSGKSHYNHTG